MKKLIILVLLPLLLFACEPEQPVIEADPVVTATITLADGNIIVLELYPAIAPNTVSNFIELAEKGFYDGTIFHQVIPGDHIEGGNPLAVGRPPLDYTIKGEFADNGFDNELSHEIGVISMARSPEDFDSANSQFFITVTDKTDLDGHYAAFGQVVAGLATAIEISQAEKDLQGQPIEPQRILTVAIDSHGQTFPPAVKIGGN